MREHPGVPSRLFELADATEWSSNIWYALAGMRTGGDDLVKFAGRMGFGAPIAFDLPTSASQVTDGDGSDPGGFGDWSSSRTRRTAKPRWSLRRSRWRSWPRPSRMAGR